MHVNISERCGFLECTHSGDGENKIGGCGCDRELSGEFVADDLGQDHDDGLAKHDSLGLNTTNTCLIDCIYQPFGSSLVLIFAMGDGFRAVEGRVVQLRGPGKTDPIP